MFWLILFGITIRQFGVGLGIPTLFLDPEYDGSSNFMSFFLLGVAISGFIMSFNIANYILDSYRFNFLGFIRRPFTHFCLNNFIIPLSYFIVYSIFFLQYQLEQDVLWADILLKYIGLILGIAITIYLTILYFGLTNTDYIKSFVDEVDKNLKKSSFTRGNILRRLNAVRKGNTVKISSYIRMPLRFTLTRKNERFDKEALVHVFDQNHFNAVLFEVFAFISFLSLAFFKDFPIFQIPAASSALLLGTVIIMLIGAISYWLRSWALSVLIIVFIILNFLVGAGFLQKKNLALGLDYSKTPKAYNLKSIYELSSDSLYTADSLAMIGILENWKNKFKTDKKPKMVFISTSGGGQRAAVWTLRSMQYADSVTDGKLMKNTTLITGASGGMIGACYFRELYYRQMHNDGIISRWSNSYLDKISLDNLNPVIFTLVVSDLFLRIQKTEYRGMSYYKDRGYSLENKLNENTDYVLNKRLIDYKFPEESAEIPLVIMSPALLNDGRKMYISAQNISFMNRAAKDYVGLEDAIIKGIEFNRFFKNYGSENLPLLTALRMNATFPYITPNIDLPSKPTMELMDSGISDNFGTADAVRFLFIFRKWIEENTSGVIFIRIRDTERIVEIEEQSFQSIISKFLNPISAIYTSWKSIQEIKNDNYIEYANKIINTPVNVIDFEYDPKVYYFPGEPKPDIKWKRAALSWHLTNKEKRSIKNAIYAPSNQEALLLLQRLLDN